MKTIAIITAMEQEGQHIIDQYTLTETKKFHTFKIFEGESDNKKFILAIAGIGKTQASIATTYILSNYEVDNLFNIGIAGNTKGDQYKIGDVFLPTKFIQHDMYLPFEGDHLDYAKKAIEISFPENTISLNVHTDSICLTGDQFIHDEAEVKKLADTYNGDVCEMEAFSIASTAREFGILDKFIAIKSISDGANDEAKDAHMDNLEYAMSTGLKVLEELISSL